MDAVTIRRATAADARAIAAAHVASWRWAYRGQLPDDLLDGLSVEEREAGWRSALELDDAGVYVALREDVVVGFASGMASRDDDALAGTGEVLTVYVLQDEAGKGTGRDLLVAVQEDVVEHAAQGVLGIVARHSVLYGLRDGNAQAAGIVRVHRQNLPAGVGVRAGAGNDCRTPGLHEHLAIGLLLVANPYHVDLAFDIEHLAGKGQRATPLAGARLGGDSFDAFLLVVIGLGHGGVGLVAAGRAGALVLVVDLGGRVQGSFPAVRAEERRRPPQRIDITHFVGDFDIALGADLLGNQCHRKQRRQISRADGLAGARMQHGRQLDTRRRQVGIDVVPMGWHVAFG